MKSVVLSILLASNIAAQSGSHDVKTRIVASEKEVVERREPGRIALRVETIEAGLRVRVVREQICLAQTIDRRTVEAYRATPEILGGGLAAGALMGGVGAASLVGGGVAASMAPELPSIDDEFSRGELSREAAWGIAAVAGTVGVVALVGGVVAGGAAAIFGRERVLERSEDEVVLESNPVGPCPSEPVPSATVHLRTWTGRGGTQRTGEDGRTVFGLDRAVLSLPESGRDWGRVDVEVDGEVVVSEGGTPSAAAFAAVLAGSDDEEQFERFRERFGSTREWEALEAQYRHIVAAREAAEREAEARAAEEERRRAEELLAQARAAFATKELERSLALLNEAERHGADVSADKPRVVLAAEAEGKRHARLALQLVEQGKLNEAEHEAQLAASLGVAADEEYERALELAKLRAATAPPSPAEEIAGHFRTHDGCLELSKDNVALFGAVAANEMADWAFSVDDAMNEEFRAVVDNEYKRQQLNKRVRSDRTLTSRFRAWRQLLSKAQFCIDADVRDVAYNGRYFVLFTSERETPPTLKGDRWSMGEVLTYGAGGISVSKWHRYSCSRHRSGLVTQCFVALRDLPKNLMDRFADEHAAAGLRIRWRWRGLGTTQTADVRMAFQWVMERTFHFPSQLRLEVLDGEEVLWVGR